MQEVLLLMFFFEVRHTVVSPLSTALKENRMARVLASCAVNLQCVYRTCINMNARLAAYIACLK